MLVALIGVFGAVVTVLLGGFLEDRRAKGRALHDSAPIFERIDKEREEALKIVHSLIDHGEEMVPSERYFLLRKAQTRWLIAYSLLIDLERFHLKFARGLLSYMLWLMAVIVGTALLYALVVDGPTLWEQRDGRETLVLLLGMFASHAVVIRYTFFQPNFVSGVRARREMLQQAGKDTSKVWLDSTGNIRTKRWYDVVW